MEWTRIRRPPVKIILAHEKQAASRSIWLRFAIVRMTSFLSLRSALDKGESPLGKRIFDICLSLHIADAGYAVPLILERWPKPCLAKLDIERKVEN